MFEANKIDFQEVGSMSEQEHKSMWTVHEEILAISARDDITKCESALAQLQSALREFSSLDEEYHLSAGSEEDLALREEDRSAILWFGILGHDRDWASCFHALARADEQGRANGFSLLLLGLLCLFGGEEVACNDERGKAYLIRSASMNNRLGALFAGYWLTNGKAPEIPIRRLREGLNDVFLLSQLDNFFLFPGRPRTMIPKEYKTRGMNFLAHAAKSPYAAGSRLLAVQLCDSCNPAACLPSLERAALLGDRSALKALGYALCGLPFNGDFHALAEERLVAVDAEKGLFYLRLLARLPLDDSNDVTDILFAVESFRDGKAVPQDEKSALQLCRVIAEHGHPSAIIALGEMIYHGRGCPHDAALAFDMLRGVRYVSHGFEDFAWRIARARLLSRMFEEGSGTPRNLEKAALYSHLAAKLDEERSLLGSIYAGAYVE
jgi:TPR repeat protein